MTDAEEKQTALLQRYQDESALLHRIMDDPSKSNNSRVAQAIVVGQCWKEFLAEFLPDSHPDRLAGVAKLNDELAYAVADACHLLTAIFNAGCFDLLPAEGDGEMHNCGNALLHMANDKLRAALKATKHG